MCGIVGYTGASQAAPFLLDGLKTLEYRGYDSAGIEVLGGDGRLRGVKCAGRVSSLAERCAKADLRSTCGIAHTRWATHGAPNDRNAHPHLDCTGRVAIVHNGIIENFSELKDELVAAGHSFASDTDSEVIAHLIEDAMAGDAAGDILVALRLACARLEGSWAVVAMSADDPGRIACARKGSPLVLASTDGGAYAASDITALAGVTSRVIQLDNGQFASLDADGSVRVFTETGDEVSSPDFLDIDWDASAATLGGYPDFMAKEISEQPEAIERLLKGRLTDNGIELDELEISDEEIAAIDRIYVVACGTSYHVGLITRTLIESWAKIPVVVEPASEFNYEDVLVTDHTLCVIITQSGETADTLASARKMHEAGARVFAITNVLGSTAARESDGVLYIQAGPEVSVCSTKAYTAQMVAAVLLTLYLAHRNGSMATGEVSRRYRELTKLPDLIRTVLDRSWQDKAAAHEFEHAGSALFLGRGVNSTTAAEGALKLKEVSYLHAEAYPAGEMKHGPIALLEPGFPVVTIVPNDRVREKTISNIQEVIARGATCIAVATDGDEDVASLVERVLWIPPTPEYFVPIVAIVHLQMLARYVALARGCDVDKPRNLAKSVTVE
ncbi:MAG: glutamine--fructose-6-phosphate transaminase (isomerizing) [Atopobiaceae bacterium]|jgi:glucosamine--fructose-6-phosphate aminotransferase (isomerizing)|nr:glutamine--fructose-6-phosphate transaminase (isomerizing) [Atopobiaceae bacterium]MCI2174098.1 glutamine--fructose-6-phosphate transaminase (isomerizing) [Atopobiaceae bacterium]MCI2206739.1 glutamine--fructose-6-phosphate transaminase (isomerizing) [Atopobiaceae bacterium]